MCSYSSIHYPRVHGKVRLRQLQRLRPRAAVPPRHPAVVPLRARRRLRRQPLQRRWWYASTIRRGSQAYANPGLRKRWYRLRSWLRLHLRRRLRRAPIRFIPSWRRGGRRWHPEGYRNLYGWQRPSHRRPSLTSSNDCPYNPPCNLCIALWSPARSVTHGPLTTGSPFISLALFPLLS